MKKYCLCFLLCLILPTFADENNNEHEEPEIFWENEIDLDSEFTDQDLQEATENSFDNSEEIETIENNEEIEAIQNKWSTEEYVVTPNTLSKNKFEQPGVIYSLDKENLQNKKMVRTVPEALKETPGVMVQKTAHGQGSPFIRGFTGFRTLFMIDGIRLNNSTFREGPNQYWNTVDFLAIEALEVVKGPGSIIYGSDAVGGVVNAITRERDAYKEDSQLNFRLYSRYATAERSYIGRGEISGNSGQDFGFLAGFHYKYFGDLTAGGDTNELPETGYDERGGDFKFNWFLSPNAEFVFAYYVVNQNDAERTHKTIFSKSFQGTTIGNEFRRKLDQDRYLTYTQLRLYDLNSFIDSATFTASWHYQDEEQDRIRSNRRRDFQGVTVNTLGASARFASESPIGTWVYGAEFYRDFVESFREDFNADGTFRSRSIQGPVADDATYDILGTYVQLEIPIHNVTIIPGIRYTHAWVDANKIEDPITGDEVSFEDDWGGFVGSLKVIYTLNQNWHFFGGISQSFRTPNLSDLTRFDTARSNEIETPVRDLDPEYFTSYEIGFKTSYDNFYFQGSYYYTDIYNMIIRFPTGNIINGDVEVTKDNEGDGFVHGVEFETGYYVTSDWLLFGGFAWMEGIVSTFPEANGIKKDEPIDRMQPAQGFIGVRWTHPSKRYWVEGLTTLVRGQDRLSTRDQADTERIPPGGTPGYTIYTIRGGAKVTENVSVSASLENISDKDYRVHGSGLNEPGINGIFSVDVNF